MALPSQVPRMDALTEAFLSALIVPGKAPDRKKLDRLRQVAQRYQGNCQLATITPQQALEYVVEVENALRVQPLKMASPGTPVLSIASRNCTLNKALLEQIGDNRVLSTVADGAPILWIDPAGYHITRDPRCRTGLLQSRVLMRTLAQLGAGTRWRMLWDGDGWRGKPI